MELIGFLTVWIGLLVIAVGGVWFIINAFRTGILWGLGVLFLPVVPLIFLILKWPIAKRPFLWQLAGAALLLLGMVVFDASIGTYHR